jgi:hypothetical protein
VIYEVNIAVLDIQNCLSKRPGLQCGVQGNCMHVNGVQGNCVHEDGVQENCVHFPAKTAHYVHSLTARVTTSMSNL